MPELKLSKMLANGNGQEPPAREASTVEVGAQASEQYLDRAQRAIKSNAGSTCFLVESWEATGAFQDRRSGNSAGMIPGAFQSKDSVSRYQVAVASNAVFALAGARQRAPGAIVSESANAGLGISRLTMPEKLIQFGFYPSLGRRNIDETRQGEKTSLRAGMPGRDGTNDFLADRNNWGCPN